MGYPLLPEARPPDMSVHMEHLSLSLLMLPALQPDIILSLLFQNSGSRMVSAHGLFCPGADTLLFSVSVLPVLSWKMVDLQIDLSLRRISFPAEKNGNLSTSFVLQNVRKSFKYNKKRYFFKYLSSWATRIRTLK